MSAAKETIQEMTEGDSATALQWLASISLGFSQRKNKTVLSARKSFGPLRVLKPFYPEGDVSHVYLLHPPGGVAGGDQIAITISVDANAHALITTPGAGKFYRSSGLPAQQIQELHVAEDATLEWMVQETLLFGHSNVKTKTQINLNKRSRFIGMELYGLGRPASGDHYDNAYFDNQLILHKENQRCFSDRLRLSPGSACLTSPWGLSGRTVFGALYATPADQIDLEQLRDHLSVYSQRVWSATCIDGLLVVRYLGDEIEEGLLLLRSAWAQIRPVVVGKKKCEPRIWST